MNKQELIGKLKTIDGGYGSRCYIAMNDVFELVEQLDEPQKVQVPQFVADWIEACSKNYLGFNLKSAMNVNTIMHYSEDHQKLLDWIKVDTNQDIFARAWLDGYEVEKEKKYKVKFKNIQSGTRYLKYDGVIEKWYFGINQDSSAVRLCHTKKELEEAGFGEVFNSPLFEVEEVEG